MEPDRLGFLFGVFAGVLLFLDALLIGVTGLATLVIHGFSTHAFLNSTSEVILAVVFGLLFIFFALLASRRQGDWALAGGVILVVLSVGTWYLLGFGLLETLAGLFGLIAGILYIVSRR